MVFIYPPPEYFKHISKDPEYIFLNSDNGYCKRVECMDNCTTYYTLPDSQELLSTHMGYKPPQNWNTYQYALQQRTFKEGIWDAYIIDSKGFSVQFLGRKKGVLNAYKLIYKHFLSILKCKTFL